MAFIPRDFSFKEQERGSGGTINVANEAFYAFLQEKGGSEVEKLTRRNANISNFSRDSPLVEHAMLAI